MLASGIGQGYQADGTPGREPSAVPPAPDAGLVARLHPAADRATRSTAACRRRPAGQRRRRAAPRPRARAAARASSAASPAARRWPRRSRSRKTAPKGSRILFMVPDTGERYLSTPLFEAIGQEMDAEELAISNSTPLCRFGGPAPAAGGRAGAPPSRRRPGPATSWRRRSAIPSSRWCCSRSNGASSRWAVRRFLARHRRALPLGRPRLGRDAGRRPRRRHPQGAARANRRADDPADLRRRRPRRRRSRRPRPHDRGELEPLLRRAGVAPAGGLERSRRAAICRNGLPAARPRDPIAESKLEAARDAAGLPDERPEPEPARQAPAGGLRPRDARRRGARLHRARGRARRSGSAACSRTGRARSSTGSTKPARDAAGIIINPGAFTHTSVAIMDALNAFEGTVIEVHISNVHKRESFRHHSYVSLRADGDHRRLRHPGLRARAAPGGCRGRRGVATPHASRGGC